MDTDKEELGVEVLVPGFEGRGPLPHDRRPRRIQGWPWPEMLG
jgi:hypothetical protein